MEIRLEEQTRAFIYAAVMGLFFGGVYDVLRAFKYVTGRQKLKNTLIDIFYCLFCAVCFMLFILSMASGQLRYYIPLGMIMGAFLYFTALSEILLKLMLIPARWIRKGFALANRLQKRGMGRFKAWALSDE